MGLFDRIKSFIGFEAPAALPQAPFPYAQPTANGTFSAEAPRAPISFQSAPSVKPVIVVSGGHPDSESVKAAVKILESQGNEVRLVARHAGVKAEEALKGASGLLLMGNNYDHAPESYGQQRIEETLSVALPPEELKRLQKAKKGVAELSAMDNEVIDNLAARAAFEKQAIAVADKMNVPMFGICSGAQSLSNYYGGDMIQDIAKITGKNDHAQTEAAHVAVQSIHLVESSDMAKISGQKHLMAPAPGAPPPSEAFNDEVNSFHHQCVHRLGSGLKPSAHYTDDVPSSSGQGTEKMIAAFEVDPNGPLAKKSISGVQFHPEFMQRNSLCQNLFQDFSEKAKSHAKGQVLMQAVQPESMIWRARIAAEQASRQQMVGSLRP